jgi:hypothetical protein
MANGVPAGARINSFFVTADADILRVGDVVITAPLYQDPNGFDAEPPNPIFVDLLPALNADSWITTPGVTAIAGGGFGHDSSAWFDTSNDGPMTHFMFAQLTNTGPGHFGGVISVAGATGPEVFEFSFELVPEPATSAMAGFILIGLTLAARRRNWYMSNLELLRTCFLARTPGR